MTIQVVFTPAGLAKDEVAGRGVFVIDVLRATTTMCAALHHGARSIIPVASIEEAIRMGQTLGPDDLLLTGERHGKPIPGFALGNSPLEMTEAQVRGKTLVMTTTNGTGALLSAAGAAHVYVAAAANLSAAAARARQLMADGLDLVVVCAGRHGAFGLDDAYTAGRLVVETIGDRRRLDDLDDAAVAAVDLVRRYGVRWERPLGRSAAARQLDAIGMADDVVEAAKQDRYPVLPVFAERRVQVAPLG
ncbi:MAG: 2-phosphosulfolactate phosphatase [Gemmatimonadetes bacterium]|nr:2-phosphosulfolactate phosphatase [Gemmatimonadota bacterium]